MEKKSIQNEKQFLEVIEERSSNNYINTIFFTQTRGVGVNIQNLKFTYFPNPIINKNKSKLFSDKIIKALSKVINKENESDDKIIDIVFLTKCEFDDSTLIFTNPESLSLDFENCLFKEPLVIPCYNKDLKFTANCIFEKLKAVPFALLPVML